MISCYIKFSYHYYFRSKSVSSIAILHYLYIIENYFEFSVYKILYYFYYILRFLSLLQIKSQTNYVGTQQIKKIRPREKQKFIIEGYFLNKTSQNNRIIEIFNIINMFVFYIQKQFFLLEGPRTHDLRKLLLGILILQLQLIVKKISLNLKKIHQKVKLSIPNIIRFMKLKKKLDPTHDVHNLKDFHFCISKIMKFLLSLTCLLCVYCYDITIGNLCTCSQINYQSDCIAQGTCNWANGVCSTQNCTAVTSFSTCANSQNCAWVNNTCSFFTKCTDYSSTSNSSCSIQGDGCSQSTTVNGTGFTCSTPQSSSNLVQCTTLTNATACNSEGLCIWNNTCRAMVCSDLAIQQACLYTMSADYKKLKTCAWSNNACVEASSLSILNASSCYNGTVMLASWNANTNQCSLCAGNSNSFIMILGLLSAIMI
ncbi:hypothetical protein pb186bvf_013862 [Paramecium bursaria]